MKETSVLEEIFERLHVYEYLKETRDPRLEEFLLLDELLSRQAVQVTDQYPLCFALGARLGFRLAQDLEKRFDIES